MILSYYGIRMVLCNCGDPMHIRHHLYMNIWVKKREKINCFWVFFTFLVGKPLKGTQSLLLILKNRFKAKFSHFGGEKWNQTQWIHSKYLFCVRHCFVQGHTSVLTTLLLLLFIQMRPDSMKRRRYILIRMIWIHWTDNLFNKSAPNQIASEMLTQLNWFGID